MDALTEEQRALIEEKKRKALEFRSRIMTNRASCLVGGAPKLSETRPVLAPRLNEFNTKPSFLESRSLPLAQSNFPKPAIGQARFPSSTPAASNKDSSSVSFNSKTTVMQPAVPSVSKPFTHVLCTLCSKTAFEVQARYHAGLSQLYKSLPSRQYNPTNRKWSFALSDYNEFVSSARKMEGIAVEGLPNVVLKVFRSAISAKQTIAQKEKAGPKDLSDYIPQDMIDVLFPFQREGVGLIVARAGRVLLADDMGLGKTVQALTAAAVYRSEWPVLIVSPSSVRFSWKDQCLRWLASPMHLTADDILVVATGRDLDGMNEYHQKLITIISYDLMARYSVQLSRCRFGVVIMDESHFLKNSKTARTKAALPILKHSKRALLLSGTPAVSRPAELYPQICGVSPDLFRGGFHEFGLRYCAAKQLPWGWDYTGCSNMTELQLILEESIMIRRTKNDVLSQLPPKRREVIILDPNAIKTGRLQRHAKTMQMTNLSDDERRSAMLQYYHQTASVKITALQQYVSDLIEVDRKFLLYAHHTEVLDAMSNLLTEKSIDFIRIDGRTNSEQRSVVCKKFQEEESCRVALLSITAAGTGLNLTAASLVVFGELYWNPGILVQAEDRAYRIGQQDSVVVRYLMAEGTADDYIWSLIERKLEVLSKAGLNKERSWQFDTTRLGPSPAEQQCILDYFGSDSPDGGCVSNAGHVDIEDSSPVFELQFQDSANEPAQKRFKVAHLFDQQVTATTSGDEPMKSRPVLVAGTPETSPNKELPVESGVVSRTEGQVHDQSISLVEDDVDDNTLLEAVLSTEVQMLTECLLNDEGLSV